MDAQPDRSIQRFWTWKRNVIRTAWNGTLAKLRAHWPWEVGGIVVSTGLGLLVGSTEGAGAGIKTGAFSLAVVALLTAGIGWFQYLIAPFLLHSEAEDRLRLATGKGDSAYLVPGPAAWFGVLRIREHRQFKPREFHYDFQNVGGTTATFVAQMTPVQGPPQHWFVPWVESQDAQLILAPWMKGSLLVFGDLIDERDNLVKRPVEVEAGRVRLRQNLDSLGWPKVTAFRLTITSNPAMERPVVVYFKCVRGGMEVVTEEEARHP